MTDFTDQATCGRNEKPLTTLTALTRADDWTDAEMRLFEARRDRLAALNWTEAEALAERLLMRDREHDRRVSCGECLHHRSGRCGNHRQAGLTTTEISRDLAELLQHCPGFADAHHTEAP